MHLYIGGQLNYLTVSIHQDGYNIHTTAGSVMPCIIRCIPTRNAGQLLSEIQQHHQLVIGGNALQI